MTSRTRQLVAMLACLASMTIARASLGQAPLTSAFTYQGHLKQAGAPVNAPADFEFRLFNAVSGGTQVGLTHAVNNVGVNAGSFTTLIDFGPEGFNGAARWMEIAVRSPAGSGQFIVLSPRQPMTIAPFAQFAAGPWATNVVTGNLSYTLGDVGVGTTSPQRRLHVRNNTLFTARFESSDPVAAVVEFTHTGANATWEYAVAGPQQPFALPSGSMYLYKQGQGLPGLAITPDNRVGIGTTSPASALSVLSHLGESAIRGETNSSSLGAITAINTATTGQAFGLTAMTSSTGGMGVYAVASAETGVSAGVYSDCHSFNGYDFYAGGAGVNYGAASSRRWKDNIEPIDDPLSMLAQIRGVYFDWDQSHGGRHDVGMIAEEVGKVLPEVVAYEANGVDAHGMDYSKLSPLLVEAIKALRAESQAQIAALQQDNRRLQERVAALENAR